MNCGVIFRIPRREYRNGEEVYYDQFERDYCSVQCAQGIKNKGKKNKVSTYTTPSKKGKKNDRSSNEILFYKYCAGRYVNVLHNVKMFGENKFDADIVLPDFKVAIMWNGIWHYEKVFKNRQSNMKKVKDIDKRKEQAIRDDGYIPYVIEDRGAASSVFVKNKFLELMNYLETDLFDIELVARAKK